MHRHFKALYKCWKTLYTFITKGEQLLFLIEFECFVCLGAEISRLILAHCDSSASLGHVASLFCLRAALCHTDAEGTSDGVGQLGRRRPAAVERGRLQR